jgi:hypothetical protein
MDPSAGEEREEPGAQLRASSLPASTHEANLYGCTTALFKAHSTGNLDSERVDVRLTSYQRVALTAISEASDSPFACALEAGRCERVADMERRLERRDKPAWR